MNKTALLPALFCATTLMTPITIAHAQEALTQTSFITLDEIIVIAPSPEPITVNMYDMDDTFPSYSYSDGASYLQFLAGITSGRFGGHGLEPVIRGQSQNQLNIIADDAFTFGGCPNRMDTPTSYLDMDSYDTISVTKGYQSVLNGPGATGGAVILDRTRPDFIQPTYDTFGKIYGGYNGNGDMWDIGGNVTVGNKDAYIRAHALTKTSNNYEDGDGTAVRSAFDDHSGGLSLGITPDKDTELSFSYDVNRIEDALFAGATMDSPLSESHTIRTGFEQSYTNGIVRHIDANAFVSMVDHIMDNYSLRTAGAMLRRVESDSDTMGGSIQTDIAINHHIIKTSLDYRYNNRDADRNQGVTESTVHTLQSVMWPDISTNEIGLAAETTVDLSGVDRLIVGGRYDYVVVDYGRADDVAAATGLSANDVYASFYGYGASKQTEHNVGGLVRLEHDINDAMTFYSSLSRSVRTADATERGLANYMVMMGDNLSWVGNPQIAPEKHHQIDVGLTKQTDQWQGDISLYTNYVSDYILRDSARGQDGILLTETGADIYRNIDAFIAGVEIQGDWTISPNWSMHADALYSYGQNLDDHMALAQMPPLQGTVTVTWQTTPHVQIGGAMRWATRQTRVDTDPTTGTGRDVGKTSGYAVFDINATVTNLEPLSVTFGMSNLFDQTYANHLNRANSVDPTEIQVNEPGRSVYVRATMPF